MLCKKRQKSLSSWRCVVSLCTAIWLHEMSRLHMPGKWLFTQSHAPVNIYKLLLWLKGLFLVVVFIYEHTFSHIFSQKKSEEISCTQVKCPELRCKNPIKMRMSDCCMRCPGKECFN